MLAAVNNVTIFGLDLKINSEAFTLPIGDGWTVYWYGIIIALGFVLALVFGYTNAKRFGVDTDRMLDVILVATPCAILGARTYYVLFDPNGHISSVKEFFGLGGDGGFSGLAIYGGIIGAVVSGVIVAKIRKVKILNMLDLASIGFLIGQGVGRWGNFFNQEAYGTFTGSTWWGMESERTAYEMGAGLVHPCFLYESIWCIAGAVLLFFLSKKRRFAGETSLMYCAWYGLGRAIIEPMRTDSLRLFPIKIENGWEFLNRVSFLVSVIIFLVGVLGLLFMYMRRKKTVTDSNYGTMFESEMQSTIVINDDEEGTEEAEKAEENTKTEENTESEEE